MGKKIKGKLFSDGKSRGPLLEGAALKFDFLNTWHWTVSLSFHFDIEPRNGEKITYHVLNALMITKNLFLKIKE